MLTEPDCRRTSRDLLSQVLLEYLRASRVGGWPGADGLTEDDIFNCYPQALADGEVPGWHELQSRFPSLASELRTLRSAKGWLESPEDRHGKRRSSLHNSETFLTHSQGVPVMHVKENESRQEAVDTDSCRLTRWLVSFASESNWYPIGEFIAPDAVTAIERAVAVFGPGAAHQAEEIPWDAAPLSKVNLSSVQR